MGDYYVIHGKKSNFIYVAGEDTIGFGINRYYLHEQVLNNFPEIKNSLRMSTVFYYSKIIAAPLAIAKQEYFADQNRKLKSGSRVRLVEKRQLPGKFLAEHGQNERFWFRRQEETDIIRENRRLEDVVE